MTGIGPAQRAAQGRRWWLSVAWIAHLLIVTALTAGIVVSIASDPSMEGGAPIGFGHFFIPLFFLGLPWSIASFFLVLSESGVTASPLIGLVILSVPGFVNVALHAWSRSRRARPNGQGQDEDRGALPTD